MATSRSRGFTLIELMVALAVAAILLVVGVPSLRDLMIRNRLSGQIQEFSTTIGFARSEAIKRGNYVSICKSANGASCGGNWSDGWIVFVDRESAGTKGTRDGINVDDDEPLLRVFPALPTNSTLNASSNFANNVTYDRLGMANDVGTFVSCTNSDESKARAIIVTKTRPRIATDADANGIPEKQDGSEITSCESP